MLMICFALQLRNPCDGVDLEETFSQTIENILSFWGSEDNPPPKKQGNVMGWSTEGELIYNPIHRVLVQSHRSPGDNLTLI